MNITGAIEDLKTTLGRMNDVKVVSEGEAPGREPVTILFSTGDAEQVRMFGRVKYQQDVILTITYHSKAATAESITAKNIDIFHAIIEDERRGGQAQQTRITTPFTKGEDNGRDGVTYTVTVQIVTDET